MANIWRKDDNVKEQPKRNIMDLTFQNNLTTQFGKLVPVFCKEFIPGDSFSIKPTFSLKFQPMVFPIQTRMRAHLHFFKVRNRNLWKDWEDFIAKNKENLDPPYLDTAVTEPKTGSLLDYLGVPTTISGRYGTELQLGSLDVSTRTKTCLMGLSSDSPFPLTRSTETIDVTDYKASLESLEGSSVSIGRAASYENKTMVVPLRLPNSSEISYQDTLIFKVSVLNNPDDFLITGTNSHLTDSMELIDAGVWRSPEPFGSLVYDFCKIIALKDGVVQKVFDYSDRIFSGSATQPNYLEYEVPRTYSDMSLYFICPSNWWYYWINSSTGENYFSEVNFYNHPISVTLSAVSDGVSDISSETSPYWRSTAADNRERIKLSALPCRAYEQIYNSFYRNAENNPYILNGVPEYNKYMPTDEGGVDANLYDFYYRNWEDDFLTTALQQPQAGIAPLVGLTGTAGTATVTLADEDGNTSEATASYDEDGNVTSVSFANNTSLTEALADAVSYGISINDLRNVNAFQRWLEAKARGGYKYRDVIETMFGITVRYDTLDMPEFIGGTSVDVFVNQISQTVPTETSPLGDYAGQASAIGTGKEINEYFDEHGFIIGILSVVPVPNYSQLLPKHFIKRDAFDYYFPQFGHIGMQPIKYNEVCPCQTFQESTEQVNALDETFGYQRAWYDYLASTDEVHGEFRTNLRNFVMNRTFDVKPELVNSFLTVDPSQLNDVFAIQDDSYDKILGQVYFDVKAKRPIPLYGIPKLE